MRRRRRFYSFETSTSTDHEMDAINMGAILDTAKALGVHEAQKPEIRTVEGRECLISHHGIQAVLTLPEKLLDHPKRKRAKVSLYESASFIDYVNRHKVAGRTHLFGVATELGGGFTAVLDYHDVETQTPSGDATQLLPTTLAHWGEHVATLTLETTPEWRRWIGNNNKPLSQEQFAEFIEDNQLDIVRPDAGVILDMAQLLQGTKTVNFKSGKNLRNGSVQLEYTEQIETGRRDDSMTLPDKFMLALVPFVGAFGVEIEARLRFRIGDGGRVSFAYVLNQPWKVIEAAFKATREEIEEETKIKVLLGSGTITSV